MRCQQVLSGAANNGNSTVSHGSYNGVGYTVYCTGCDVVILDDVFHRVQLITNISGCRSQITAITLCPATGKIGAVCSHSVYILSPQPSTNGDDIFSYKWSLHFTLSIGSRVSCAMFNFDGSQIIVTGSELLIYKTGDWKCAWNTHLTEDTIQLTVSPDGRFFTTLSKDSKILKLWKQIKDSKDYRSELIPHPAVVIGASWRQIPPELPRDSVRQVLLTSCHDCIGRIWLETPSGHPSISPRRFHTKSFVLGTVLDPLKESTEKKVDGSPYIFQWFNNKSYSYSLCLENARLNGELLLSEQLSVSSYDIGEEGDFNLSDTEQQVEGVEKEVLELREGKVLDIKEYKYTAAQLLKLWYKSFDMVVCVSPATGSLMGWRVEKIDVAYPFQALTTRFVLKLPWSLSYADARQLKPNFTVFSTRKINTKSHKDRLVVPNRTRPCTNSVPDLDGTLVDVRTINMPTISLLTAHFDGTVNLFTFEMGAQDVTFTDIGNLVHEVRCSGHRCPPLTTLSHPYIPVVLTTSSETGSLCGPGYGELILWRVSCIGPMTTRKTGILELARVDTKRAADFTAVTWFPRAFSVAPPSSTPHAGVLTSFVLHFVAFTGHSLELYRVVTLSESLHTAKMILDRSNSRKAGLFENNNGVVIDEEVWDIMSGLVNNNPSISGDKLVSEEQLCSKSSGSGASKIYHLGKIAEAAGDCALLHTFPLQAVRDLHGEDNQKTDLEGIEKFYVVMVDNSSNKNSITTIEVQISNEDEPFGALKNPMKVQNVHNSYFCASWSTVSSQPAPLPPLVSMTQCAPSAATVATPKFVPPGTKSPYLFSSLCSDHTIRFFTLTDSWSWVTWPVTSLRCSQLKVPGDLSNTYTCNSIPGRLAVAQAKPAGLTVSMFESESSGGVCWTLEDTLDLECSQKTGPVLMDFMSAANGTHILAIVQEDMMWILTACSCISLHSSSSGLVTHQPSKQIESWVCLLRVHLSTNGAAQPRSLSWNSTGSLLLGINTELQLYSPWYSSQEVTLDSHNHLERGVGNVYNDALSLQPRLPQYHPYVLRQLIDNRKVTEVKMILHYLLRYLASYYRSSKLRTKPESNIITIIPPLPLHDLNNLLPSMFQDTDSDMEGALQGDYSALFTTPAHFDDSDDDQAMFSDEEEHKEIHRRSITHSESGFDSVFCFDSKRAAALDEFLSLYQLPGVTRGEQLALSCLALTVGSTAQSFSHHMHSQPAGQDLDDCGLRFTLELRYQNSISKRSERLPLQPNDCIWAFHSSCQTQLIELIPGFKEKSLTWDGLKSVGVGWWVKSGIALKNLIEIVCKTKFQETRNPLECGLFYLAMKKKTLFQSLYRTVRNKKMSDFLKHDFTEARWKTAAKKNAFVLLGQQRYEHAAAFFLLADSLEDTLEIVLKYCKDTQLALVIARLYEEPQNATLGVNPETSTDYNVCFKRILSTYILGRAPSGEYSGGSLKAIRYDDNPFICSMAHWWLGEYQSSLYCLLRPVIRRDASQSSHILPHVFSFYCYLYHHPILRRCKDPVRLPFEVEEEQSNDVTQVISLERRMIFITAYTQFNMGCPSLSLDVLKHIEKGFTVLTKERKAEGLTAEADVSQICTGMLSSGLDSSVELDSGSVTDTAGGLVDSSWMTMGAPVKSSRFDLDEEYEIDFSSDSDTSVEEEGTAGVTVDLVTAASHLNVDDKTSECSLDSLDEIQTPTDPFIVQFRLKCCIKILADELRFLPHALLDQFDPELGPFGGRAKVRTRIDSTKMELSQNYFPQPIPLAGANQLGLKVCQWLKNEIDTISEVCNLKYSDLELVDLDGTVDGEDTLLAEAEMFSYQLEKSILTVLLLFCILHGDLDYNLAALRLELLFLLQEFHSSRNLSALMSHMESDGALVNIPPLLTTTAPPPLLLSPLNMLWQLTGHTLKLINRSPVHHNIRQPEIGILNCLSLSASACMWQCLALRHGTQRIPNSYAIVKHQPLSWPGLSGNTVYFLVSAGKAFLVNKEKEGALPIAIVLVEAIISVYLGLFLHALCNSEAGILNQLLNNVPCIDMWTKVTGTTVQSVDTSSPRPPKKRVSIMGERIRVKGPRGPHENVVTVRETFLPPSMSLMEFFRREPNVDTSNMFEVDSDCEETLDDEGDDAENFNCYSWYLMRLLSVTYVRDKLYNFFDDLGLSPAELSGMSPLLASSMKTLEHWTEDLLDQVEGSYPEGAPEGLLQAPSPGHSLQQGLAEPSCTPFRQNSAESLQARVLWHKLATDTPMSDYMRVKEKETVTELDGDVKSSVKTIFRANEGVSSFSCYQNRVSWIVVTTLREVMEIDVKTFMDRDRGVKEDASDDGSNSNFVIISNEDNKTKSSHLLEQQISSSEGNVELFNQILKRSESGVRCSTAHSDLPLYLTGNTDGYVKLWEFGYPHPLAKYGISGNRGRVISVKFDPLGGKFGLSDTNGVVGLWHTTVSSLTPYCVLSCHDRAARDFAFLASSSVIASVGNSSNNRNVAIWDTLLPPSECAVKKFQAHEMGAMVCCYSPKRQLLITGGNKGDVCIFDVRQRKLQHMFTAHDSAVRSMCLSYDDEMYFTGSSEGDIKSWDLSGAGGADQHSYCFSEGHKSTKLFSNLPGGSLKGVMKLQVDSTNHLVSCGADGEVKLRLL